MANDKKYYWIRLKEDFFEDDTISYIEEQQNGKDYCLFYLKLCLKALRNNGKIIRIVGDGVIPYDVNSLSKLTNTPVDTVAIALTLFKQLGLISVLDNGEFYINQINEMIGSETNKAELMRKKRALKSSKKDGNNVTQMLPECYSTVTTCYEVLPECSKNVTQRLEIRDKDINTKKEVKEKTATVDSLISEQPIEIQENLKAFVEARKKMKAPMTPRAMSIALSKLDGFSLAERNKMLEQSIMCGYKGIFSVNSNFNKSTNGVQNDSADMGWDE